MNLDLTIMSNQDLNDIYGVLSNSLDFPVIRKAQEDSFEKSQEAIRDELKHRARFFIGNSSDVDYGMGKTVNGNKGQKGIIVDVYDSGSVIVRWPEITNNLS